jgi:hypothetical protein
MLLLWFLLGQCLANPSADQDSARLAHEEMIRATAEADEHWNEEHRQNEARRGIEEQELAEADEHARQIDENEAITREEEALEMHRLEEEERRMHEEEAEELDRLTAFEEQEKLDWAYEQKKNHTYHEEEIQEILVAERRKREAENMKEHDTEYQRHQASLEKDIDGGAKMEDELVHLNDPGLPARGSEL